MENKNVYEKEIMLFAKEAQSLDVMDQETANRAEKLILVGKEIIKKIKDYFAPLKKEIDEVERVELMKVERYIQKLQSGLIVWALEQERKKWEVEEARRRAELERKRLNKISEQGE